MIDAAQARRMVSGRNRATFFSRVSRESIRGDHSYATPPEATNAFLRVERFVGPIWEPACGNGAISLVLEASGYEVISTDLTNNGFGQGKIDFLMELSPLAPNIITNPPYKNGLAFAEQAVRLATGKVAFLMRLVWLEGISRQAFFKRSPLARVWVFSKRIPRMHRVGYEGPKSSSSIAFAWFVWEHGHEGPPVLGWI